MNFNTCFALLKREYYEMRSVILWLSIITFLILFLNALSALQMAANYQQIGTSINAISGFYFAGGVLLSSFAFWEFRNPVESRSYLLLPATSLEKIVTKIIVYSFAWLFLFICCWVAANFFILVVLALLSLTTEVGQFKTVFSGIFTNGAEVVVKTVMYQALCIFASCYFRRYVLLKLAIVYVLIILPLQVIISHELISFIEILTENAIVAPATNFSHLKLTIKLITILALLLLSWLRLRETEAK